MATALPHTAPDPIALAPSARFGASSLGLCLVLHVAGMLWAMVCLSSQLEAGTWLALSAWGGSVLAFLGAAVWRVQLGTAVRVALLLVVLVSVFLLANCCVEFWELGGHRERRRIVGSTSKLGFGWTVTAPRPVLAVSIAAGGLIAGFLAKWSLSPLFARLQSKKKARPFALAGAAIALMAMFQYQRVFGGELSVLLAPGSGWTRLMVGCCALLGLWIIMFQVRSGWVVAGTSAALLGCSVALGPAIWGLFFANTRDQDAFWLVVTCPAAFSCFFLAAGLLLRRISIPGSRAVDVRRTFVAVLAALALGLSGWVAARAFDWPMLIEGEAPAIARATMWARRERMVLEAVQPACRVTLSDNASPAGVESIWRTLSPGGLYSSLHVDQVQPETELSFLRQTADAARTQPASVQLVRGQISAGQFADVLDVPSVLLRQVGLVDQSVPSKVMVTKSLEIHGDHACCVQYLKAIDLARSTGTIVFRVFEPVDPSSEAGEAVSKSVAEMAALLDRTDMNCRVTWYARFWTMSQSDLATIFAPGKGHSGVRLESTVIPVGLNRPMIDAALQSGWNWSVGPLYQVTEPGQMIELMPLLMAEPARFRTEYIAWDSWAGSEASLGDEERLEQFHLVVRPEDDPEGLTTLLPPSLMWIDDLDAPALGRIGRLVAGSGVVPSATFGKQPLPAQLLARLTGLRELYCDHVETISNLAPGMLASLKVLQPGVLFDPPSRAALAAAVEKMPQLETLILLEYPDANLVKKLGAHEHFQRLVLLLDEAGEDEQDRQEILEQIRSALAGVAIEIRPKETRIENELPAIRNHRSRLSRELQEAIDR